MANGIDIFPSKQPDAIPVADNLLPRTDTYSAWQGASFRIRRVTQNARGPCPRRPLNHHQSANRHRRRIEPCRQLHLDSSREATARSQPNCHPLPTDRLEAGSHTVVSRLALHTSVERLAAEYTTPMPSAYLPRTSRAARKRGCKTLCCWSPRLSAWRG